MTSSDPHQLGLSRVGLDVIILKKDRRAALYASLGLQWSSVEGGGRGFGLGVTILQKNGGVALYASLGLQRSEVEAGRRDLVLT